MPTPEFLKAIETITGRSVQEIQDTPVDVSKARMEEKSGKPIEVKGSVNGVILSHEEVEKMVDEALR